MASEKKLFAIWPIFTYIEYENKWDDRAKRKQIICFVAKQKKLIWFVAEHKKNPIIQM